MLAYISWGPRIAGKTCTFQPCFIVFGQSFIQSEVCVPSEPMPLFVSGVLMDSEVFNQSVNESQDGTLRESRFVEDEAKGL